MNTENKILNDIHSVYIVKAGDCNIDKIDQALCDNNFVTSIFDYKDELDKAVKNNIPSAVILCVNTKADDINILRSTITKIKERTNGNLPIIVISSSDMFDMRLIAARYNVNKYFTSPVSEQLIVNTLIEITQTEPEKIYRVILIDDEETILECYKAVLENAGAEVKTVQKPRESLDVIETFQPDIIFVDINMPECTGPELVKIIRQDERYNFIPIIYLTGESEPEKHLSALSYGGEGYLVKPVSYSQLWSTVVSGVKQANERKSMTCNLDTAIQESKYQLITMNKHNIISASDIAGNITEVNDKFIAISGYKKEELIGQNHRILKSGYHNDAFYEDLWKTISSGNVWHGQLCNLSKEGKEYWVDSTIVPFLDADGIPYKYISARTDITDLRKNEERLTSSQQFANIGTWDWNIRTGELFWSERIAPLLGLKNGEFEVTFDTFINIVHPDDRDNLLTAVNNCIEHDLPFDVEHRVVWPDGTNHWLQQRGHVLRGNDNEALRMLGIIQDISSQKHAESELVKARKDAEHANKVKSEFLTSMSHELKTPMNAIIGFSQLMVSETQFPLHESQQENAREIITAASLLLGLINKVLDFSTIENGDFKITYEEVNLDLILYEAVSFILPLAAKHQIKISVLRDGIEMNPDQLQNCQIIVSTDSERLKQILLNLLGNAVKYNNEGGKITIQYDTSAEKECHITITDTGKGLSDEQISRLFIPFERLGIERSKIEGAGIGLTISKILAEKMNCKLNVTSKLNHGTTFDLMIPLLNTQNSRHKNTSTNIKHTTNATDKSKHTVIYIEDNPANMRLVMKVLERRKNIDFLSANEPVHGLKLATEHQPSVILLDINLPGMNGYDVLQELRNNTSTNNIPVIAVSANAMKKDIERGIEAGFNAYITKPIDIEELVNKVDEHLA